MENNDSVNKNDSLIDLLKWGDLISEIKKQIKKEIVTSTLVKEAEKLGRLQHKLNMAKITATTTNCSSVLKQKINDLTTSVFNDFIKNNEALKIDSDMAQYIHSRLIDNELDIKAAPGGIIFNPSGLYIDTDIHPNRIGPNTASGSSIKREVIDEKFFKDLIDELKSANNTLQKAIDLIEKF